MSGIDFSWTRLVVGDEGIDMKTGSWIVLSLGVIVAPASAQDTSYLPQSTQDVGYATPFEGVGSVGNNEQLFRYDDQERWKHGYIRNMPYYEGYGAFRPYNYHHVFSQAQTAAGWGMPANMPYSQQFWHRYQNMTDLSRGDHSPVAPYTPPAKEWDHYPKPIRPGASLPPDMRMPGRQAPDFQSQEMILPGAPPAPLPAYPTQQGQVPPETMQRDVSSLPLPPVTMHSTSGLSRVPMNARPQLVQPVQGNWNGTQAVNPPGLMAP